jgi:hypothetical protein
MAAYDVASTIWQALPLADQEHLGVGTQVEIEIKV